MHRTDGDEERHRPVTARNDDTSPRQNLVHVVGAGNKREAVAVRDLALSAARRPQAGEIQVHQGVANLAKQVEHSAGGVNKRLVRGGSQRPGAVVDGPGAQGAGKGPVEEAVFEDVARGHGVCGELVDEERLNLALGKVRHDHAEAEPLRGGHGWVLEEVRPGGDGEAVEEDGAEIFDDEDGSPGNLEA